MEVISAGKILEEYRKGRRNFDKVKASDQDFHGFNLRGASFKKADLSWGHFDTADLSDCDFSGASLTWSGIRRVNLRNTKFVKANVSYSDFNGSTFDKTDFTDADLTACLLFNVNLGGAILKGANMAWTATHISQLDEAGLRFVMKNLKAMGREISAELLVHIELVVKKVHEVKAQLQDMAMGYAKAATSKESSAYQAKMRGLEKEIDRLYTSFETLYGKAMRYGEDREGKATKKYK